MNVLKKMPPIPWVTCKLTCAFAPILSKLGVQSPNVGMTQGYQFWTQADTEGYFTINNIRTGVYDVYGWVPGVIGDYKYAGESLHIQPG